MTAVTADNTNDIQVKQLLPDGYIVNLPVGDAVTIYKNTFVGLDATGYLESYVAYGQAATPTGNRFIGVALEHVDNSAGVDAAKTCDVQISGFIRYPLTSAAQLDIGCPVHATDNATLTKVGYNNALVGTIVSVPASGYVVVDMLSPTARMLTGSTGSYITKMCEVDFGAALNTAIVLLHETENHNGAILNRCWGYVTEVFACDTTAPVVTIGHTRGTETSLGCTLTGVDALPLADLIMGSGGIASDGSSNDALVLATADKAVLAKVTTLGVESGTLAGKAVVFAEFAML